MLALDFPAQSPRHAHPPYGNQARLEASFGEALASHFIFLPRASFSLPTLLKKKKNYKVNFVLASKLDEFKCPISAYSP